MCHCTKNYSQTIQNCAIVGNDKQIASCSKVDLQNSNLEEMTTQQLITLCGNQQEKIIKLEEQIRAANVIDTLIAGSYLNFFLDETWNNYPHIFKYFTGIFEASDVTNVLLKNLTSAKCIVEGQEKEFMVGATGQFQKVDVIQTSASQDIPLKHEPNNTNSIKSPTGDLEEVAEVVETIEILEDSKKQSILQLKDEIFHHEDAEDLDLGIGTCTEESEEEVLKYIKYRKYIYIFVFIRINFYLFM